KVYIPRPTTVLTIRTGAGTRSGRFSRLKQGGEVMARLRLEVLPLRVMQVQGVALGADRQDLLSAELPEAGEGGRVPYLEHALVTEVADDQVRVQDARGHVAIGGDVHP